MTKYFLGLLLISLSFVSCKKDTEVFITQTISDYYPLQVGKYITYDLDSTVFIHFGQEDTVIHYQAQDRVDAQITDNIGRPAYRIIHYIRADSTQEWVPNNTFEAIPTENSLEYVENNLRYIKLQLPIKQDFSWKGNAYIDTYSANSDVVYLDNWDYTYDSIGVPLTINSLTFDSTLKVAERDEFLGQDPSIPGTEYGERNYSTEKYAKGIGLIYREFLHWEYQGPQSLFPGYSGYGIKLSITGHN